MYIPLYNKSNYSLLSSLLKIDDIINYAVTNNITSIALTDNNMFGTMEFIYKCKDNNIKPIVGLELKFNESIIVLYAENYNGYKNIIKLCSIQNEREINERDIVSYNKNVICIIPYAYRGLYSSLKTIFNNIYIGYSNKIEENDIINITNNVVFFKKNLYFNKIDSNYLKYLYMIRDGKTVSDDFTYDVENYSLNINNLYDLTDNVGLINSIRISESCNLEFPKPSILLPKYECEDTNKYLFSLCKKGLYKRLNDNVSDVYKERLLYELNVINNMGFSNYFLVVYDFIRFAKKNRILVGPGRGSAAGSLVAYSLGITEIDPIKYNLLFERFLNPARKTMPDIDTDFPDDKRDDVINYVIDKYGKRKVAGIITFGTLGCKQVIRDVGRVLNIPIYKIDSLCKFIPGTSKESIKDFYNNNSTFKARIDSDSLLTNMYNIALKLEGFPRHTSHHAAGIVICSEDLDEIVPVTYSDDMYLTCYSKEYIEDLGLLKMDFLGLKNLTIIDNILKDIKNTYGLDIDFNKIPLDDKETLKVFETGNTCGIFQFESNGMKNFLRRLKPNCFEDIFAAIALFRPGPAINIDSYIRRKHGLEEVKYIDESLKDILENTYGIFIYQEQIMQVASVYAGYSLEEADLLRRAISGKNVELLKSNEATFIEKSIKNEHSKEQAKEIFDLILNFAGYGFNRSHSVAYSLIAYKMAYLKTYYKTIFFANLLTNVIGSVSKTHEYIMEAKANNIEIVKPSINESSYKYMVKDNKIIYPLSNIKSIGTVVTNTIEKAKCTGDFIDIYDCFSRLYIEGVGKKTFETLILADVFKEFNYNRATLIYNLDNLFNYSELTKELDKDFVMKPEIEIKEEYHESYLLEQEKELFGFYLSSHPTTNYKKDNPYVITINLLPKYFNKQVDTLILVEKVKIIETKKGDKMSFVTGSDETGSMDYTLFPKTYNLYYDIERGDLLKVRGKVEKRQDQYQIIVDKIKYLNKEERNEE